jgi:SEC-C motif domain protein
MRSRYAAFVLENAAYLLATWHPTTRPASIAFTPGQVWQVLRVLATSTTGTAATVEFSARSRIGGSSHVLHEISRFVHEAGRWYYLDGSIR